MINIKWAWEFEWGIRCVQTSILATARDFDE